MVLNSLSYILFVFNFLSIEFTAERLGERIMERKEKRLSKPLSSIWIQTELCRRTGYAYFSLYYWKKTTHSVALARANVSHGFRSDTLKKHITRTKYRPS